MDGGKGYEIVITEDPGIRVPPICPGCGGRTENEVHLFVPRGPTLRVGLCLACNTARLRAESSSTGLLKVTLGAALASFAALLAMGPSSEVAMMLVPPLVVLLAGAVFWKRSLPAIAGTTTGERATYRSRPAFRSPPLPIAFSSMGRDETLLYCANAVWASAFAEKNRFVLREPTRRPGFLNSAFALAWAFVLTGASSLVLWNFYWPVLLVDNGAEVPVTIFVDGESRGVVLPLRGRAPLAGFRVPRGEHRVAYQREDSERREEAVVADVRGLALTVGSYRLLGLGPRMIYNPGALACYRGYAVHYAPRRAPLPDDADSDEDFLPREQLVQSDAHHLFEGPPQSVSSKAETVRRVVLRDELCGSLARARCPNAVMDRFEDCVLGETTVEGERACQARALEECRASSSPPSGP